MNEKIGTGVSSEKEKVKESQSQSVTPSLDTPSGAELGSSQATTTAKLIWLRWLLQDLGVDCSTATKLHFDNRSAIQIGHNDVFHEHTKHIKIDCHFVRHHLLQGTLTLQSVSS